LEKSKTDFIFIMFFLTAKIIKLIYYKQKTCLAKKILQTVNDGSKEK